MTVNWEDFNYSRDLQIDIDSLELEAQDCPALTMHYSEEKNRVAKSMKLAKENLNVVRSQLVKRCISEADKKPTVAEIDAYVATSDEYRKAHEEFVELEYEHDMLKDACNAMRDRKEMIQELDRQISMNYFSRVSLTNGNRKEKADIASQASNESRQEVNKRMRRRRK